MGYWIWEKGSCWEYSVLDSQASVSWAIVRPALKLRGLSIFHERKKPLRCLSSLLYGLPPMWNDLPQMLGFLEVSRPGNWWCELSGNVSLFLKVAGWWKPLPPFPSDRSWDLSAKNLVFSCPTPTPAKDSYTWVAPSSESAGVFVKNAISWPRLLSQDPLGVVSTGNLYLKQFLLRHYSRWKGTDP